MMQRSAAAVAAALFPPNRKSGKYPPLTGSSRSKGQEGADGQEDHAC